MAFVFPSRSNRLQVLTPSPWWSVTLNHQQLALCFHFQWHGSSFLSLTRLGHSLYLVRWMAGSREKERRKRKKPQAIYNQTVCFNALNARDLASVTGASSVITSELWFHGFKWSRRERSRENRTTSSWERGWCFLTDSPTPERNLSTKYALLN